MVGARLRDHPAGALGAAALLRRPGPRLRLWQPSALTAPLSSARMRWAIRAAPRSSIDARSRSDSSRAQVVVGQQPPDRRDDVRVVDQRADPEEDDAGVVAQVRVGRLARVWPRARPPACRSRPPRTRVRPAEVRTRSASSISAAMLHWLPGDADSLRNSSVAAPGAGDPQTSTSGTSLGQQMRAARAEPGRVSAAEGDQDALGALANRPLAASSGTRCEGSRTPGPDELSTRPVVAHRVQRVHHPVGKAGPSAQILDVDHAEAGGRSSAPPPRRCPARR